VNRKQKESTAKYLYDISKGIALLVVIGNMVQGKWDIITLTFGSIGAFVFFIGHTYLKEVLKMSDMAIFFLIIAIIGIVIVGWIYYKEKHSH